MFSKTKYHDLGFAFTDFQRGKISGNNVTIIAFRDCRALRNLCLSTYFRHLINCWINDHFLRNQINIPTILLNGINIVFSNPSIAISTIPAPKLCIATILLLFGHVFRDKPMNPHNRIHHRIWQIVSWNEQFCSFRLRLGPRNPLMPKNHASIVLLI